MTTYTQNLVTAFETIAIDVVSVEQRLKQLESGSNQTAPTNLWPITPPELLPPDPAGELPAWAKTTDQPTDLSTYAPVDLRLACLGYNLFDLQLNTALDIATDSGLDTPILISLFTDRYDPESGQGGWWGDQHPDQPDLFGSRLWLLNKSKVTTQVLRQAEDYARESLAWLINDKLINTLNVSARWERANTDSSTSYRLRLAIAATLNPLSHYGKTLNREYLI
jgi:phage gp46-like protein